MKTTFIAFFNEILVIGALIYFTIVNINNNNRQPSPEVQILEDEERSESSSSNDNYVLFSAYSKPKRSNRRIFCSNSDISLEEYISESDSDEDKGE